MVRQASWSHSLTAAELSELTPFLERIALLKDELTGGQLISVFVGRRVQPLQHRASPMWQYDGPSDLTRCSPQVLEADDILTRVQWVAKCSSVSEMKLARPYAADYAPPQVCVRVSSLVWLTAWFAIC